MGFIASGLLIARARANLLAYYFAFRLVGHYLSLRGARQGLERRRVDERDERAAVGAAPRDRRSTPEERERRVHDVAPTRCNLEHLVELLRARPPVPNG